MKPRGIQTLALQLSIGEKSACQIDGLAAGESPTGPFAARVPVLHGLGGCVGCV